MGDILAQKICIQLNFWDSGVDFVDVNYKFITGPDFSVAKPISEAQ